MKHQKGFTLTEVLVAMAIAGIAGAILIALLVQNNGLFYTQSAKINQGVALNDSVTSISNDIRSSSAVVAGYPVSSPTTLSGTSSIVLQYPSLDSNGDVIDQTFDYLTITQDASNPQILREQVFPDAQSTRKSGNKVLATNLSDVNFSYFDNSGNTITPSAATKVGFSIILLNNIAGHPQQSSGSAVITLRNN